MNFDGSPMKLAAKRHYGVDKKEIPEHLIRPAIDEEKLMKIREMERMKKQEFEKSIGGKRMSMGQ